MAYMVYQQYTAAIKEAYRYHDVTQHAETASSFRRWLSDLEIDAKVRNGLVEQARVIEEAFHDLARNNSSEATSPSGWTGGGDRRGR